MKHDLLHDTLAVVNVGLEMFTSSVAQAGAPLVHLDWRPAGDGDPKLAWTLAQLTGDADDPDAIGSRIDRANDAATNRMLAARPVLIDVSLRADAIWPELWANGRKTLTHAGAPIPWARMCDPMKGTMIGAMLYENWADTPEDAAERLARGEVEFLPNHDIGAVGPMSGAISPSMPVFVVKNATHGNLAYTNFTEGIGRVLRFGAYGPDVIERLRWIAAVLAPAIKAALGCIPGGVDLKAIQSQALLMGDEVHSRNSAATALFHMAIGGRARGQRLRSRALARGARFHRRDEPVLPQPVDGRVQGDHGRDARRGRLFDRHRHREERRDHRDPGERAGRSLVRGALGHADRVVLSRVLAGRCQRRFGRQRDLRDRGLWRAVARGFACAGATGRRKRCASRGVLARDVPRHLDAQSGDVAAESRIRGCARGDRSAQGGGYGDSAGGDDRHCAQAGGSRADRRGDRAGAVGVFYAGAGGAGGSIPFFCFCFGKNFFNCLLGDNNNPHRGSSFLVLSMWWLGVGGGGFGGSAHAPGGWDLRPKGPWTQRAPGPREGGGTPPSRWGAAVPPASRKADVDAQTRLITSIYLPEEEFAVLAAALPGVRIRKLRHRFQSLPGILMLVDEFQGGLEGLFLAEADFKTRDLLAAFPMPDFAVREVTDDPRFSGANLAVNGLPKDL